MTNDTTIEAAQHTNPGEAEPVASNAETTITQGKTALGGESEVHEVEAAAPEANEEGETRKETPEVNAELEGAPETYEAFTLPEGMTINEPMLEKFTAKAKELNLSQEKSQEFMDLAAEHTQQVLEHIASQQAQQVELWAEEAKADSEIGGTKYQESVSVALKAVSRFGTPELRELMDMSGVGNHPEMIRFCNRVGKAISEGALHGIGADAPPPAPKTIADRMYPNQSQT